MAPSSRKCVYVREIEKQFSFASIRPIYQHFLHWLAACAPRPHEALPLQPAGGQNPVVIPATELQ